VYAQCVLELAIDLNLRDNTKLLTLQLLPQEAQAFFER
jgi:hypothetical protein